MKRRTPALLPQENIMFLLSGGHSSKAPSETEQTLYKWTKTVTCKFPIDYASFSVCYFSKSFNMRNGTLLKL